MQLWQYQWIGNNETNLMRNGAERRVKIISAKPHSGGGKPQMRDISTRLAGQDANHPGLFLLIVLGLLQYLFSRYGGKGEMKKTFQPNSGLFPSNCPILGEIKSTHSPQQSLGVIRGIRSMLSLTSQTDACCICGAASKCE